MPAKKRDFDAEAEMLRRQHEINHNKYMANVNSSLVKFQEQIDRICKDIEVYRSQDSARFSGLSVTLDELQNDLLLSMHQVIQSVGEIDKDFKQFKSHIDKRLSIAESKADKVDANFLEIGEIKELIRNLELQYHRKLKALEDQSLKYYHLSIQNMEAVKKEMDDRPDLIEPMKKEMRDFVSVMAVNVEGARKEAERSNRSVFINMKHFEHLDNRLKKLEEK